MTGKIAHALKQKFGTPERMMAALGLDQALLEGAAAATPACD